MRDPLPASGERVARAFGRFPPPLQRAGGGGGGGPFQVTRTAPHPARAVALATLSPQRRGEGTNRVRPPALFPLMQMRSRSLHFGQLRPAPLPHPSAPSERFRSA